MPPSDGVRPGRAELHHLGNLPAVHGRLEGLARGQPGFGGGRRRHRRGRRFKGGRPVAKLSAGGGGAGAEGREQVCSGERRLAAAVGAVVATASRHPSRSHRVTTAAGATDGFGAASTSSVHPRVEQRRA